MSMPFQSLSHLPKLRVPYSGSHSGWIYLYTLSPPSSFSLVSDQPLYTVFLMDTAGRLLNLDFFFIEKRYTRPSSTIGATVLAISFGSAYSLWIEYASSINGRFPYPFLTIMPVFWRLVMYVSSTFGALMTFWGLNAVHT